MGGGTSFTRFLENIGLIQAEKQRLDFEVTDSGAGENQRSNSLGAPKKAGCDCAMAPHCVPQRSRPMAPDANH
jgi:hypothetical protein